MDRVETNRVNDSPEKGRGPDCVGRWHGLHKLNRSAKDGSSGPSPPSAKSIPLDARRQISTLSTWLAAGFGVEKSRDSFRYLSVSSVHPETPEDCSVYSETSEDCLRDPETSRAGNVVTTHCPATISTAPVPSSAPVQGWGGFPSGTVQHPSERRMGESPESKARSAENPGTQAATRPSSFRSERGSVEPPANRGGTK